MTSTPDPRVTDTCCCYACSMARGEDVGLRMILCPDCGNKRCPHATSHHNPCSGSNEPGQHGSIYGVYP